ncbi:MAG: hypothetical protein JRF30_00340 [Deltaproteobacteria bacterium]|nr:hypothetical protein [Deltaproteobacteria bacterium]
MTANKRKQTDTNVTLGGARSRKRSGVRPGYINFGSHLDPYNSLSARLRSEIDRRCFTRQDVETR